MSEHAVDVVVVGAGIVGVASAAALARAGRSVIVLERHDAIAHETTSRNSQVIHAGIYYPAESQKARFCVAGREALYARCAAHGVPHRQTGKLIVAVDDEEIPTLADLAARGTRNGAPDLELVDAAAVRRLEPDVRAVAGLVSPRTGIVDAHALALSYLAEAEAHGAELLRRCVLLGLEAAPPGWRVEVEEASGERAEVRCAAVVNAAGLESDRVAALAGLDVDALGLRLHPCKGDYFALAPGAALSVTRLIYPVPVQAGLGVHATLDLGGRIRFGPDTEYVDAPRYDVDPAKGARFAAAVRRYLPRLDPAWLTPDGAGVRPKLAGPGEAFRDFEVAEAGAHGAPGLVNAIGIESPGLTAAPAIADHIAALLRAL